MKLKEDTIHAMKGMGNPMNLSNNQGQSNCPANVSGAPFRLIAVVGLFVLALVILIEIISLRLWKADLSVPFNYWGDTLWFIVPIKGIVENGWAYVITQLSAPFDLSAVAFPSMTNLDWLIIKGISLFISDAGTALNVFWLLSIVLTAWTATLAFSLLGVRIWLAIGGAVIYAFLPFVFLRNVAHISLVYYCVPLLALLAIYFARGCDHPQARTVQLVGYCAVIAQGFNYIYFSFFSVLLFVFAGWVGYMQKGSWKPVRGAAIASILIVGTASVNLLPSFLSWHIHGKPPNMSYKAAQEAEVYGLKIRKMLAPNEANNVPIFSHWGRSDRSAGFPNENENSTARLGPFAAAGFLLLLMVSAGLIKALPVAELAQVKPIAALALFSLLFTTVGGFGAVLNQVLPDFRGYNRFSVFIAFFAVAGILLWWQGRMQIAVTSRQKKLLVAGLVVFGVFSLYDQLLDAAHLNNRRASDEASAKHEREFVMKIEDKVPAGTSIFQLPITGFPPDGGKERMLPYDHARPYLWSSKLNWSWPSFSQQHASWLAQLDGLTGANLLESLVLSKFGLIWIDRFGYADNGQQMLSTLLAAGANDLFPGTSTRYVVLDLSKVAERLQLQLGAPVFNQRQQSSLNAPRLSWRKGVYALEHNPEGRRFHWSQAESSAEIHYSGSKPWRGALTFYVAAGKQGNFSASCEKEMISAIVNDVPTLLQLPLTLEPGSSALVRFVGDMGKIDLPPGETRDLYFYLMDMHLQPENN